MTDLFLDIETVESQDERIRAHVRAKVAALDDLDETMKAEDLAIARTALNAAFGEIVCISAAVDDREPKTWARALGESEADLLSLFFVDTMTLCKRRPVRLIGHNVLGFDRTFIRQRGIVHSMHVPSLFTREIKPWATDVVCDTMHLWTGSHRGTISLDDLCCALGLPGKGDVNGGDVGRLMREGKHAEVAVYCADDVRKTRAVFRRMTGVAT